MPTAKKKTTAKKPAPKKAPAKKAPAKKAAPKKVVKIKRKALPDKSPVKSPDKSKQAEGTWTTKPIGKADPTDPKEPKRPPKRRAKKVEPEPVAPVLGGGPLPDALDMQRMIVEAAHGKQVQREVAEAALSAVLTHHEGQLVAFLVAAAKTKMKTITDSMELIGDIQSRLRNTDLIYSMDSEKLMRLLNLEHTTQAQNLAFIKAVTEMRRQMEPDAFRFADDVVAGDSKKEKLPELDRKGRENVRQLADAIMEILPDEITIQ